MPYNLLGKIWEVMPVEIHNRIGYWSMCTKEKEGDILLMGQAIGIFSYDPGVLAP